MKRDVAGIDNDIEAGLLCLALEFHSQFFHDSQRSAVFRHSDGDHTRQAAFRHAIGQRGLRCLGRQTTAPVLFSQTPADLDFAFAIEFKRLQAAKSGETTFGLQQELP